MDEKTKNQTLKKEDLPKRFKTKGWSFLMLLLLNCQFLKLLSFSLLQSHLLVSL